jgi:hypothetical protein
MKLNHVIVVAAWNEIQRITGSQNAIKKLCDLSSLWKNKDMIVINMVHAALLRALWLMRNDLVFNRVVWPGMQNLWRKNACLLAQWKILVPEIEKRKLKVLGRR